MEKYDVIVIGAGASGLMAARELVNNRNKVLVLEAKQRVGGRIYTLNEEGGIVEAGAEFIHGRFPLTMELFKRSNAHVVQVEGNNHVFKNGKLSKEEIFIEGWEELIEKLKELHEDISIKEFLDTRFAESKFDKLKKSVTDFVEGYDAADVTMVRALAVKEEWMVDNVSLDFRIKEGYDVLVKYLEREIVDGGGDVRLSTIVNEVRWSRGQVNVVTNTGFNYQSGSVVVTVPLGVLKNSNKASSIIFNPSIPAAMNAINKIGFGAVIKVIFVFNKPFWFDYNDKSGINHKLDNPSFFFSNAFMPTWWTQYPYRNSILTGWIAGEKAHNIKDWKEEAILEKAIESISLIFNVSEEWLEDQIVSRKVFNWTADPYIQGGYAYSSIGSVEARKILSDPVDHTIYFAGEGIYEGPEMGTVEAALVTGKRVAEKIIGKFK